MIAESDKLQDTELLRCATELERDGVTVLPPLVSASQLTAMQRAFAVKLRNLRWNNFDGYQKTEPYRLMVEDVLLLDQGFVDIAIHPTVKAVLSKYLGTKYELTEAKGWKSLPTKRDFHGWHGDAWYDQKGLREIPREVKLAFYLTDVRSGAFNYIKGSHRKQHPRPVRNDELLDVDSSQIAEFYGPAGTAFVFDTSGIHRQGVPMLEPRQAVFYNYHDPGITLQQEDITYYRYHPLLLNAAFLGGMSDDDRRVLGFGNKTNFIPAFERSTKPTSLYTLFRTTYEAQVHIRHFAERLGARWRRTFHK
ncbi:MAG TPA: phytanoyl-CoA dioxygenase family protein [Pyrinomonadaceae bacterium]